MSLAQDLLQGVDVWINTPRRPWEACGTSGYLPAAAAFRGRSVDGARLARELGAWTETLERHWGEVRFGDVIVSPERDGWSFEAHVYLVDIVAVELYADAADGQEPVRHPLKRRGDIPALADACMYRGAVPASSRPWWHFTPRIVPHHRDAFVPIEAPFIVWADAHTVRLSGAAV